MTQAEVDAVLKSLPDAIVSALESALWATCITQESVNYGLERFAAQYLQETQEPKP